MILELVPDAMPHGAHGLDPIVLLGVAAIFVLAKLGGELFARLNQPAVLGELISGIIAGNLFHVGFNAFEPLKSQEVISALAELGIIIMLFEIGLEAKVREMLEVGWSSLLVAIAGVVMPMLLGIGIASLFIPTEVFLGKLFIGATLCATSIGITARVLRDMGWLRSREARIILGAAVIDDVLGLLILAVITGAIQAFNDGSSISYTQVGLITVKALAFLAGSLLIGHFLVPRLIKRAARLQGDGVMLALALAFCFITAWAAASIGLAPIVGAFAAGLVLEEVHFKPFHERGERALHELLAPVSSILVPIFFVLMGLKVDLKYFADINLAGFALALTLVAIVGKQVCSLAVIERGVNRLAIGIGMIPRGEVGLIFASIGASLFLPNAAGISEPVIGAASFGAIIIMIIITTIITPPALKWTLARKSSF